ncbi:reverse transcriptase [Plakobranchus ocellatus]|uniref:Reverse transcriptase n=1 Tax=Plakobranchus ocellatus TaxID=259542 RepID=A0AAV4A390_9GAST|nr:reverse transcriptase [Plakobranchus ocellatus]
MRYGFMAPLTLSFPVRAVYDLSPSNVYLVQWAMKDDPTCPQCLSKQTTEHVLSSCNIAQSQQGRYTWRHNRVLQELVIAKCDAKGLLVQPKARALVYTLAGGAKFWCESATGMDTQRKTLMDGCYDREFSADFSELEQAT